MLKGEPQSESSQGENISPWASVWRPVLACLALATSTFLATADLALSQSRTRIFETQLNAPIDLIPSDEWVDPACGTNGGPPSLELAGFHQFAACPVEEETGLHEVWFIYDDEWEYIARAYRDPVQIGTYADNTFYGQPIITSLLLDDAGLVQGYRVTTDPRAPTEVREQAYLLFGVFKTLFSGGTWECTDHPPGEAETPMKGDFLKSDCMMRSDDRLISIEGRLLRKPGQDRFQVAPDGYFESSARLEVYYVDAVMDAPCCQAFVSR